MVLVRKILKKKHEFLIIIKFLDEGHFQKLLDNEVQALKNACLGKEIF